MSELQYLRHNLPSQVIPRLGGTTSRFSCSRGPRYAPTSSMPTWPWKLAVAKHPVTDGVFGYLIQCDHVDTSVRLLLHGIAQSFEQVDVGSPARSS